MANKTVVIRVTINGQDFEHRGEMSEILTGNLERTMAKGFNPGATLLGMAEQGMPESRVELAAEMLEFSLQPQPAIIDRNSLDHPDYKLLQEE